MLLGRGFVANVKHGLSKPRQDVRYETPMTLPPQNLRAHDRRPHARGNHGQPEQAFGELLAFDMVRVAAKTIYPPAVIWRITHRIPAPSEGWDPYEGNSGTAKRALEL